MILGQPELKRKRFCPYLQKTPKTFPEGQASPPWAGLQAGAAVQLLEELLTPALSTGKASKYMPVSTKDHTRLTDRLYLHESLSNLWFSSTNKHYFQSYQDKIQLAQRAIQELKYTTVA